MSEVDIYKLFAVHLRDIDGAPLSVYNCRGGAVYHIAENVAGALGRTWENINELGINHDRPLGPSEASAVGHLSMENCWCEEVNPLGHPELQDSVLNPLDLRLAIITRKEYATVMGARK